VQVLGADGQVEAGHTRQLLDGGHIELEQQLARQVVTVKLLNAAALVLLRQRLHSGCVPLTLLLLLAVSGCWWGGTAAARLFALGCAAGAWRCYCCCCAQAAARLLDGADQQGVMGVNEAVAAAPRRAPVQAAAYLSVVWV
jgi:hypothetical protein